jgi:hypothetical protein
MWQRVLVPRDNQRAFQLLDLFGTGQVTPVFTLELQAWLEQVDEDDYFCRRPVDGPVMFSFYFPNDALLFKLTWGGK